MRNENYIPITDAAVEFPVQPSRSTLWRYTVHGLRGVRLQTIRSAGRVLTTKEWVWAFIEQSSAMRPETPVSPSIKERQRLYVDSVRRLQNVHRLKVEPASADELAAAERAANLHHD